MNCLPADSSHENIMPYFFGKLRKMSQNLSSAAFVIGALRVIKEASTVFVCGLCVAVQQTLTLVITFEGAQWLSGRVLDSRSRGHGLEPHRHHCIVSLSKTH